MTKKSILMLLLSTTMIFTAGIAMTSCGDSGAGTSNIEAKATATIKFDINLDGYKTNVVKDKTVSIGKRVPIAKAYITNENPDNLQLYGWYTDAACTNMWDFKNDRVQGDMTLYAKWVEQYNVNYYVNGEFLKTEFAFKGDNLTEDPSLVAGFKYLGTYVDAAHETAYNYQDPVSGDTNLYIKRSLGIYMSDHVEEGELSSGTLTDYLVAYIGSTSLDEKGNLVESEGWVEPYTVMTQYADGIVEENCTYVNFGYQPKYGDGYVELCLALDISQSQIIRVWFKNLGPAKTLNAYFTAMLDADNNSYSETGSIYTQDFCYPNYTGSGVEGGIELDYDQMNMDETAEWTYVDFNLHEVYKNGYSIWGTSPYLGSLRIQANYQNTSEDDWSNEFLIKAIEGVQHDIVVEDSGEVNALLTDAANTTPQALENVSQAQAENPQGLIFPKNYNDSMPTVTEGAQVYNTTNGLLFYAENEILGRDKKKPSYGFTLSVPEGKSIDLSELSTLAITLKNHGYAEKITVLIYNDIGIPITAQFKLTKQMQESRTYTANLYGKYGMYGNLSKIEVQYQAVGVDNAITFESIQMSAFVPYDIVGINLNDKYCFGLASTDNIDVSFDSNRSGTLFNVETSGASVTSADRIYDATSDGYSTATLQYYLHRGSNITAVKVAYKIDGKFTSDYVYELDTQNQGVTNSVSVPLKLNERGNVKAIRLTFVGTGKVLLKAIEYGVGATSLPFYQSYEDVYKAMDWELSNTYRYDSDLKASMLIKDPTQAMSSFSLYIGYSALMAGHHSIPHTTKNVLVTETTKVKIVYQNRTDVNKMNVTIAFSKTDIGVGDGEGIAELTCHNTAIDCSMEDYEWSTLTIDVPTDYVEKYLAKITLGFAGKEIAVRAISIETGE